jgi:general secretion pathway protein H
MRGTGRLRTHARRRIAGRGLSLLELLVVVTVIAMLAGVAIMGSGALGSSRIRADAAMLTGAVRTATARANTTGRPARLAFDLDAHRIQLEESTGRMLRKKDEEESTGAGASPVTEAEQRAAKEAKGFLDGPRAPPAMFAPVSDEMGFASDKGNGGRALSSGVRFRSVQTDHDGEPRTEGRAYLYFWPGGGTERAVIQLEREGAETGLSVLVSALTGRSRVKSGYIDLIEPKAGDDFGEVEVD